MAERQLHLEFLILSFLLSIAVPPSLTYAQYGQACKTTVFYNRNEECDRSAFLTCQNGFCACHTNGTDAFYHPISKKCTILLGTRCDPKYFSSTTNACAAGACNTVTKICSCYSGRAASHDGMSCSKLIDETCSSDAECGYRQTLMKCVAGQCSCPNSLDNYFDRDAAICRVHTGSTCRPGSQLSCDAEADCVPVPKLDKVSWCQCNANYPTATKQTSIRGLDSPHFGQAPCVRLAQFGEQCSSHQYNYATSKRIVCDENAQLMCKDEKCICQFRTGLQWDNEKKSCVSGLHGQCFIPTNGNGTFTYIYGGTTPRDSAYKGTLCATGLQCVTTYEDQFGQKGICALT